MATPIHTHALPCHDGRRKRSTLPYRASMAKKIKSPTNHTRNTTSKYCANKYTMSLLPPAETIIVRIVRKKYCLPVIFFIFCHSEFMMFEFIARSADSGQLQ